MPVGEYTGAGGSMSIEYIRETYNVPATIGGSVKYKSPYGREIEGTIRGVIGCTLLVHFDGRNGLHQFLPKDLTYTVEEA